MSGLFGSITIKGNRLTEFANQTATVGIPIPFGFGKFPCEGNVIFAPMPPKEHVKKKKQGKGGVKSEEYSYTLSYAIAFCEGPIFGFWTIKRNGKVVWTQDPAASVDDLAYAAKWAQKATFYYGTETQLPDSTIESYKGTGLVSAFRGIAYIVVEDDDVTADGGAVPTYEAICIGIGTAYATTPPYVVEGYDELGLHQVTISDGELFSSIIVYDEIPEDFVQLEQVTISDGELRPVVVIAAEQDPDELQLEQVTISDGELDTILVTAAEQDPDELQLEPVTISDGELETIVITAATQDPQSLQLEQVTISNGILGIF